MSTLLQCMFVAAAPVVQPLIAVHGCLSRELERLPCYGRPLHTHTCWPARLLTLPHLAGAVYVRRHTEHSSNIVLRHNPHRSELPQLPAVVDAKKAPAQRKDGQAAGAGGKAAGAGAASSKLGAELLVRLDGFLQQFLDGAYDLLMTQVSPSASSCQSTLLEC